jgi:hypothetical protein
VIENQQTSKDADDDVTEQQEAVCTEGCHNSERGFGTTSREVNSWVVP